MISPAVAAKLCRQIYAPVAPGVFSTVYSILGVNVGYALIDGVNTFTFAGSESVQDWLRNLSAVPHPHGQLGVLHAGFWEGMQETFDTLRPIITGKVSIHGHSLGCAHAAILAGLCVFAGIRIDQLVLFAPPHVSFSTLPMLLKTHVGAVHAYRNGPDPVPQVPIPMIFEPWTPIADYIHFHESPGGIRDLDPAAYHSMQLYESGVQKL